MGEYRNIFESLFNDDFDNLKEELAATKYKIINGKMIIENVNNVSINREQKKLKVDNVFIASIGEYEKLRRGVDKILIEFEDYFVEYYIKPVSKMVIERKNEI